MVLFCTIILLPDKQLKAQVFVLFDLIAHVGFLDSSEGGNLISSADAYIALRELFHLNIKVFHINQGNFLLGLSHSISSTIASHTMLIPS